MYEVVGLPFSEKLYWLPRKRISVVVRERTDRSRRSQSWRPRRCSRRRLRPQAPRCLLRGPRGAARGPASHSVHGGREANTTRVYFSDGKWFSGGSRKRKITGFPFFSGFSDRKTIWNSNFGFRHFPTGFRCFPTGFRCFPTGKCCWWSEIVKSVRKN